MPKNGAALWIRWKKRLSEISSRSERSTALPKRLGKFFLAMAKQVRRSRRDPPEWIVAEDASIIPDGQTVTGKVALRAFYQPVFENITWSPTHAEASKGGTLDYTFGN